MDKAALTRATDSTSAPTPGYLYNDIAKTLNTPQACSDTLAFLLSRLAKNNVHIKRKCLKVISKICGSPCSRGMMKRCVVQNPTAISAIKEALGYRGIVDAVTGDTYNVEVREAAKECLEVVYSDAGEMSSTMTGGGGGLGGGGMAMMGVGGGMMANTTGYGGGGGGGAGYGAPMGSGPPPGSSGMGSGGTSPSRSSGNNRMEGIGNPMFADPRLSQNNHSNVAGLGQLGEIASNVGGAMLDMIKDPLARNIESTIIGGGFGGARGGGGGGGYNPNARPDPYSQPPPGRGNLSMQTGGQWTMASNRGPNAIGSAANANPSTTTTTTTTQHHHQHSEYYKTRDAQAQGGPAFSWAASGGGGAVSAAAAAASGPPAAPTGVGGSWATVPVAPPPQHHHHSNMSVASAALQPPVATVQPNNYTGGNSYGVGVGVAASTSTGAGGGGDYERNLILDLCPPGGMKAEPPQDKLEEFARAVPSLNPDVVCPALLDALEEGNPWIMRAKALCVIETVLKVEAERNGEVQAYSDFFHACSGEIEPLVNHARASVKGPAKRVLSLLGIDEISMNGTATNATAVAAQDPVTPAADLLDFGDEPLASPITELPIVAPLPSSGANASTSVTATASTGASLFSGLNTKAASAPAIPAVPVAATPQQQDDLLGGLSSEPTDAVTSNSADLFSNVAVKSTDAKVESAPSTVAAFEPTVNATLSTAPGSAFGFMNATPATPVPPPPPPVTVTSPSTPSFDPLLSMGISNNNTAIAPTASMTPQMQQMQIAYQQNMMMMQQQMQQMQMQRGNTGVPGLPLTMPVLSPMPTQTSKQPIMGANYMRQVPGVSGDKMSSFSFLGSDPKKKDNNSFDFVKDAMKNEK